MTSSNTFNPSAKTISTGGVVVWNNTTGVTHNVTFTTSGAPTGIADNSSGVHSITFSQAGTYSYHCTHHSGMDGTITVQ